MTSRSFAAAALALALAGCFDSIVSDRCAPSYVYDGTRCVSGAGPVPDGGTAGGPDGGIPVGADAAPVADAPACSPDLATDPFNCGTCGNTCASGACSAGVCVGSLPGHIVAIGHDYAADNPAMTYVLGDAVALGQHATVAVIRMHDGTDGSSSIAGAISAGLGHYGRAWHDLAAPSAPSPSAFAAADVVVVEPRHGDGDALASEGATWQPAFAQLIARGGVVVVLEGTTSASYRFAAGASLYTIDPPVDITGQLVQVAIATDAVAQQVVSPYLAESSSVALPGGASPVIATMTAQPVVLHLVR